MKGGGGKGGGGEKCYPFLFDLQKRKRSRPRRAHLFLVPDFRKRRGGKKRGGLVVPTIEQNMEKGGGW